MFLVPSPLLVSVFMLFMMIGLFIQVGSKVDPIFMKLDEMLKLRHIMIMILFFVFAVAALALAP
jgi:hypothetical protein